MQPRMLTLITGSATLPLNMTIFGNAIHTPRLRLRRISVEDLPLLSNWSNSPEAFGDYLTPGGLVEGQSEAEFNDHIHWSDHNKFFLIERKDGTALGTIHYWIRPERLDCAVIKVQICEPGLRGQGYGTEAQKFLVINLFERAKLTEIEMYTDINNSPQQRCLTKLGFEVVDSLSYNDHQITRLGFLYRLKQETFNQHPIYQYHYE